MLTFQDKSTVNVKSNVLQIMKRIINCLTAKEYLLVYSVAGLFVFFLCIVQKIIEERKILFRTVITINQN